jgi:hypothetical protein
MAMTCPHCKQIATRDSSRQLSSVTKEAYYQCKNLECGHTFKSYEQVVYTLSPSGTPDPTVYLPLSPRKQRQPEPTAQGDMF